MLLDTHLGCMRQLLDGKELLTNEEEEMGDPQRWRQAFQKSVRHSQYGKTNLEEEAPESDTRHLVSVHTLE